jgi:hypothetical protein
MPENERQQRIIERIQEDERLRGDLEDDAATPLINWAIQRASAVAANTALPDDSVDAEVQAVRKAVQAAARSGETEPTRLIALAEGALNQSLAQSPGAAQATLGVPPTDTQPAPPPETQAAPASPDTRQQAPSPEAQPEPAASPATQSAPATQPAPAAPATTPAGPAPAKREAVETVSRARRKRSRITSYLKHLLGKR